MRRFLSRYLVSAGVAVNLLLALLVVAWLWQKFVSSDVYEQTRRQFLGPLDGVSVTPIEPVSPGQINPQLKALAPQRWVKIHQQSGGGREDFARQAHGGAAFDPLRGRVVLFGSDTHRTNWDNTVRFFDMGSLSWSSAYPPDDPGSYRVNPDGLPVAGKAGDHPWAMHSFDAVEIDPFFDRLIVASHPKHMSPGKSWGFDAALWRKIKRHPTWVYHLAENRWEPLPAKPVSFFPYATTFDPARGSVIGVKSDGYFELAGDPPRWRRIAKGTPNAWHVAAAYDTDRDTVVAFGTHNRSNAVWQYSRFDKAGKKMPTPGIRPPGADSVPLVYHPGIKRVVALVEAGSAESGGRTETWLYATADDAWKRLEQADIPFKVGMNYHMVYDPGHDLLVLVANMKGEPPAVWVLRL